MGATFSISWTVSTDLTVLASPQRTRLIWLCCTGVAFSAFAFGATPKSIRDVDLENFSYPFIESDSVPNTVRWMQISKAPSIALKDGRHTLVSEDCRDAPLECPLLTLDKIQYGELTGIPQEAAIVLMTYHSGGTATWQYLYAVALSAGKPEVLAWLETGSRADKGLREVSIDRGDLVLTVNDPARRQGDCCSTGIITTRYRWNAGAFKQIGQPVVSDAPTAGPEIQSVRSQTASGQPAAAPSGPRVPRPSFDCSKASTPTEKLICNDAGLAAMDSAMAAVYQEALQKSPADEKARILHEQSKWFKQYISSSAANIFLSSYVPTAVTQNSLVSGELNGTTVPDPRTHGDVMFISANNAHDQYLVGPGLPFIGSLTNTITHRCAAF
jgi:hypothetical protein